MVGIKERMKRYEERSNPVMRFIEEFCDEEIGTNILLREFTSTLNKYLQAKHLRIMTTRQVGFVLRDEGFMVSARKLESGETGKVILNLSIIIKAKLPKLPKLPKSQIDTHVRPTDEFSSSGSSGSFPEGKPDSAHINKTHVNSTETDEKTTEKKGKLPFWAIEDEK